MYENATANDRDLDVGHKVTEIRDSLLLLIFVVVIYLLGIFDMHIHVAYGRSGAASVRGSGNHYYSWA